ncbi:Uncharacterized protein FKW44_013870 [Caligus rogercresseyi]|uniref:Uncharacterized protein n=1 Tax=Caligus rogercresseyi TaxID=217165 RepID=A0A7T8JZJ7_CALRO|nr:Uncharacterized protein FKW44_013870 [Caligus rogercresseyi]
MFTENIKKLEASDWWSLIKRKCSSGTTVEFARLMKSLHSCPANSAGIERCFSTLGFVWSKPETD